jgi:hypothetical protein
MSTPHPLVTADPLLTSTKLSSSHNDVNAVQAQIDTLQAQLATLTNQKIAMLSGTPLAADVKNQDEAARTSTLNTRLNWFQGYRLEIDLEMSHLTLLTRELQSKSSRLTKALYHASSNIAEVADSLYSLLMQTKLELQNAHTKIAQLERDREAMTRVLKQAVADRQLLNSLQTASVPIPVTHAPTPVAPAPTPVASVTTTATSASTPVVSAPTSIAPVPTIGYVTTLVPPPSAVSTPAASSIQSAPSKAAASALPISSAEPSAAPITFLLNKAVAATNTNANPNPNMRHSDRPPLLLPA